MCGILGTFSSLSFYHEKDVLKNGLEALKHRGPNDSGIESFEAGLGVVSLGHTRLSVIDLSSAGHQPIRADEGRFVLVFNGEIYNYRELREELKAEGVLFNGESDTEVLLQAWVNWGSPCLDRLVGMFAFAVFDRVAQTLTCVRDPFGIKPLFYASDKNAFVFASELSALKALKPEKPTLNVQRAYDYLVFGKYDVGAETFYQGVFHLPPGSYLVHDLKTGVTEQPVKWWCPKIEESKWTYDDAVESVRKRFLENIRLHLRSDVPLGAALSGGIDSSAVVCAIRHLEPDMPIHTFSYIAQDTSISEEFWVDKVNEFVGAVSYKVTVGLDELAQDLDSLIKAQGEPFGSTSIYAQYRVFKLARENGITVTLDGQGADEMLAGYNGYPGPRLRSLLEKGQFLDACRFVEGWGEWPGRHRTTALKKLVGEYSHGAIYQFLRQINGTASVPSWVNRSVLKERQIALFTDRVRPAVSHSGRRLMAELAQSLTEVGLPALLRHGDRNSMEFSIESRVPFLTTEMVSQLLSMPEHYLISEQGETKHIFRAAMRGIVPDDLLDRKDKVGFATPEKDLLLAKSDMIRSWLSEDIGLDFIDQSKIIAEFDAIVAGKIPFTKQVWRWVNFIRWFQLNFR